ncbi:MAG: putative metal-binding motif-containing protein [Alphaproteobacteria bacterium]|nr:putative metal-binding motif-containing protein [Alphaproteobacteria bacterium]
MKTLIALAALFASAPAFATSHVLEFNILACPTVPSNIGFTYDAPDNSTTWTVNGTERFYAACSHFSSPSLAIDGPGNDVSYTIESNASQVVVPTSMWIEAAPGPLGPLVEHVTIRQGTTELFFDLTGGPVHADLTPLRGLRTNDTIVVEANGALLFDDFAYELEDDNDLDGWTTSEGDCSDSDASVHPGAVDIIGDGIDQDCDGADAQAALPFQALAVMPSCPSAGPLHIVWTDGTPNGLVRIFPAPARTSSSVWTGTSCTGRLLGVTPAATPPPVSSGPNGSGYFVLPNVGSYACGAKIQLLDLGSCAISEVLTIE